MYTWSVWYHIFKSESSLHSLLFVLVWAVLVNKWFQIVQVVETILHCCHAKHSPNPQAIVENNFLRKKITLDLIFFRWILYAYDYQNITVSITKKGRTSFGEQGKWSCRHDLTWPKMKLTEHFFRAKKIFSRKCWFIESKILRNWVIFSSNVSDFFTDIILSFQVKIIPIAVRQFHNVDFRQMLKSLAILKNTEWVISI